MAVPGCIVYLSLIHIYNHALDFGTDALLDTCRTLDLSLIHICRRNFKSSWYKRAAKQLFGYLLDALCWRQDGKTDTDYSKRLYRRGGAADAASESAKMGNSYGVKRK